MSDRTPEGYDKYSKSFYRTCASSVRVQIEELLDIGNDLLEEIGIKKESYLGMAALLVLDRSFSQAKMKEIHEAYDKLIDSAKTIHEMSDNYHKQVDAYRTIAQAIKEGRVDHDLKPKKP